MTGILKFLLGLLLLPAMTALTLAFTAELGRLKLLKDLFGAGVVTYVFLASLCLYPTSPF